MDDYKEPETFEDWVAIHGEPEFLYENRDDSDDTPQINHIKLEDGETERSFDKAIYPVKNGLQINYANFVDVFAANKHCIYCNGTFYTPDGMVSNADIRKEIATTLKNHGWSAKLDAPTSSLFNSLKDLQSVERLPVDETVIPFKNGNLHIDKKVWEFRENEKLQTPYRLAVDYVDEVKPMPLFTKWLCDVFAQEDLKTIQDMLGYLLVPVTAAQEAFFLVGDGGVGKSVLGIILDAIFGNANRAITTQELVTQRFQLSTAENKLVMYDDDLGEGALTETATLKKLITADQKIPAERKYGDPYEFQPYCKIVACANFMLSSLYDDSDGFYRRLHPILVKEKDPHRRIIRDFGKLIVDSEKEQIARWALTGLKRVIANGWEITWSKRSREYMGAVKASGNHYEEFLNEVCDFDPACDVTSQELRTAYGAWCRSNSVEPTFKRLPQWLNDNGTKLNIRYSNHVRRGDKFLRGYGGMAIKHQWKPI